MEAAAVQWLVPTMEGMNVAVVTKERRMGAERAPAHKRQMDSPSLHAFRCRNCALLSSSSPISSPHRGERNQEYLVHKGPTGACWWSVTFLAQIVMPMAPQQLPLGAAASSWLCLFFRRGFACTKPRYPQFRGGMESGQILTARRCVSRTWGQSIVSHGH